MSVSNRKITFQLEWNDAEITRVMLRAPNGAMPSRVCQRDRHAPLRGARDDKRPKWLESVIHRLETHLSGTPQSFTDVPLNWEGIPPFHRRVYKALQQVPPGKTVSYGDLARMVGIPGAARAVGQAMARNPYPILVPCHRVVASGGQLGGFSGGRGIATKRELLALEGVSV